VRNRGALHWYHAHPHHRTGVQVHQGMAGLLLVEDEADDRLRAQLGLTWGTTEIPLIVQDKAVGRLNRLRYSMGEDDWVGNRTLVNWTPEPYLDVERRWYRFRLLNASNARAYRLAFVQGETAMALHLVGTDGGLLERAYEVTELFLAPAQRADVLVDFSGLDAGGQVWLRSLTYDAMDNEPAVERQPADTHPHNPPLAGTPLDLLLLRIQARREPGGPLPASLSRLAAVQRTASVTRRFRLHTDGLRWYINGYNYHQDMRAILASPRRGALEMWEIANDVASMPHPMHLHGFQFRALARDGSPAQIAGLAVDDAGLTPQDLGWLDTVVVWPGETVRIAIDFSHDFAGDQTYMFHCHNLEHEDQGMMMNVKVTG
jgi:FtsP/CotA-like multicopper oxidase with cupredoxin domain